MQAAALRFTPLLSLIFALAVCGASGADDPSAPRAAADPAAVAPSSPASPASLSSLALAPEAGPPSGRAVIGKPSAPVVVSLATRRLGGGEHEVTLAARPTRDVPSLALTLDGRREQLGAVRAGETRTLTVRIRLADGEGRDVVASAATGTGNRRRSRAAIVRVGAPAVAAPPLPVRIITLSDGTELAEVRP